MKRRKLYIAYGSNMNKEQIYHEKINADFQDDEFDECECGHHHGEDHECCGHCHHEEE